MLSHHIYWNLGAYVDEQGLTHLNDTLYMPYSKRYIQTDGILIPNGSIGVTAGTGLDFTKPGTVIGDNIPNTEGFCGTGCTGIDNAFITDRSPYAAPKTPMDVLKTWSPSTGIELTVETDQDGIQIYNCVGQNGTIPVKVSQQHIEGQTTYVEKYGCLVIETQDVSNIAALDECGSLTDILELVDRRHQQPSMGTRGVPDLLSNNSASSELRQIQIQCRGPVK